MNKYVKSFLIGALVAFPLGYNMGMDRPVLSNPFSSEPDIAHRIIQRTAQVADEIKSAIHNATKPAERPAHQTALNQVESQP